MASRLNDDDDTPHLEMSKKWKKAFEEIFVVFSPDKWKLGPTDRDMPRGWRQFNDSAKVKFLCACGNSWTSMAGRIIFWFKKIEESEKKEEATTTEAKGKNEKEEGEDSGSTSIKDTKNRSVYSLKFKLYGQQCQKCDDEDFQKPRWYEEEVRKVLTNVHKKIGEAFYGFPSQEIDNSKRRGRPQRSHDSRRCQACREGHCTQRFSI